MAGDFLSLRWGLDYGCQLNSLTGSCFSALWLEPRISIQNLSLSSSAESRTHFVFDRSLLTACVVSITNECCTEQATKTLLISWEANLSSVINLVDQKHQQSALASHHKLTV